MSNRLTTIIAFSILIFVFFATFFSMSGDSLTMDELAHLPAGYSYLTQRDMRLNPEHPPLIKDLSAFPLLFIPNIHFPYQVKDWTTEVNGQWGFGYQLLFNSGNPADLMILLGRIPMILVLLLLGFYIFKWSRERFGNNAGILALVLFSLSPTLLAHGRLVTTDVGAAAGFLISMYYFLKALEAPTKRNIILAGLFFGLAQLAKFSTVILVPLFILFGLIWIFLKKESFAKFLKMLLLIFIIGYLLLGLVYAYHVWNYPTDRMISDITVLQKNRPIPLITPVLEIILGMMSKIGFLQPVSGWVHSTFPALFDLSLILSWMAVIPFLKPFAQYLLGLFLVIQRSLGGNTTYFLGEVSAAGWKIYFPVVYTIKETLTYHILAIGALLYSVYSIKRPFWKDSFQRISGWINNHYTEFVMLAFIGFYWMSSLTSNLNIGVRHLMPIIPFTILLITEAINLWLKEPFLKVKYVLLGALILWQAFSVYSIYPHYLAYFNEIVGGAGKGYLYVTDSNLDWGQDIKRLKKWVDENNIDRIYVDYFGGTSASYYLQEKFAPWWGSRNPNELPRGSYLAVSATLLQGGRGKAGSGFDQPTGYYNWLNQYPVYKKIGYSIFVYRID